ncbi:RNA methyltransferase, putative [Babesia microti strain RI]|uniref:RNA methyltransferase, putative n=1 Tax=Babesia microti (strain RI) TaxID=1133968 RepID=A0A1R4AA36_BABMR|nr:RNA methyltransferase, putative [Babesia microti strain RI]SJK85878.1 RNA methyltransferase, putative [Babesia microti strain RI]|eukprot:XP_021338089.1 RNA methyltransferase, putative [Babesia microti strain RI]
MESPDSNKRNRTDGYDLIKSLKHIPQRIPFLGKPTSSTVSIAIPISILANCQTEELRAYVVGNIARTCAIFGIAEIVLFNDFESLSENELKRYKNKPHMQPHSLMNYFTLILEYLETPQYLRRSIFDYEKDLKFAGLLNPLDAPHHMRANEWLPFRQGILLPGYSMEGGSVDCGLPVPVLVDNVKDYFNVKLSRKEKKKVNIENVKGGQVIEDHKSNRVTVQLDIKSLSLCAKLKYTDGQCQEEVQFSGKIVPNSLPTTLMGLYWGYTVRQCQTFEEIFTSVNYEYDLVIGTSEHGEVISGQFKLPKFEHLLIVFGGLKGLEVVIDKPEKKFKYYINICEHQHSRTIRTEEAIMICLARLYPFV